MRSTMRHAVLLVALVLAAPSCGGDMMDEPAPPPAHGTNEQVGRVIFASLCQRFASCYPGPFVGMYPAGVPACVDRFVAAQAPSILGQVNACSDAMVSACASDVAVLDCQATADRHLPTSCTSCAP